MAAKLVMVAAPEQKTAADIGGCLGKSFRVDMASTLEACLEMFRARRYEFTFIDLSFLPKGNSLNGRSGYTEAFQPFRQAFPAAHLIVLTPPDRIREAVAAVKTGASDYLTYPLDPHDVLYVIESLSEFQQLESELLHLRERTLPKDLMEGARTNSPLMAEVLDKARRVAPTKTTVLLTGETGTGKGVMAKLIHSQSNRASGPFIAVHCGAIPDTLLESELFGHEKGSFTGAMRRKLGKFEIAGSGTIFLDEIGTLSPTAQIKLLQVLQEKTFARVGGDALIEADVRVLAATNTDLAKLCREGGFRSDLFYRLNVFPIEVPPLRMRTEDIPLLLELFMERLNANYLKAIKGVAPEVIEMLKRYPWPGNIREMENLVERAYILEKGPILTADNFPSEMVAFEPINPSAQREAPTLAEVRHRALEQLEKRYLREILTLNKGRIDQTAAMAGVTTRQLRNLLVKYGLRKEEFK